MEPSERTSSDQRSTSQRDRDWMACEIHDGLLQSVIAAHMMAESLRAKWPAEAGEPKELQRLLVHLQHAMAEGRQLIDQFHGGPIAADDLQTAIEVLVGMTSDGPSIDFHLDLQVPPNLPSATLQTIYRVVQEALSNVRRHSQATRVEIRVHPHAPTGVELMIADNGCGFAPGFVKNGHFGLESMRRRVESLGGQFQIETAPQAGTRITAQLP